MVYFDESQKHGLSDYCQSHFRDEPNRTTTAEHRGVVSFIFHGGAGQNRGTARAQFGGLGKH